MSNLQPRRPAGLISYGIKISALQSKRYFRWGDRIHEAAENLTNPEKFFADSWYNSYWQKKLRVDVHVTHQLQTILDKLELQYQLGLPLVVEIDVVYRSHYMVFMMYTLINLIDEFHCTVTYQGYSNDLLHFEVSI